MTDKPFDDSKELPYRFVYCPTTGEIMIIAVLGMNLGVLLSLEDKSAFNRFLEEGNRTAYLISAKVLQQVDDMLKRKLEGEI